MSWIIFALSAALFDSLKDITSKHNLKKIDEYVVGWSLRIFALVFLLPLLLFIKVPQLGNQFWQALIIGGLINLATTIMYMKAIKHSDLSLTVPFVTFTPLFLLVTSPLIVKEFPKLLGLIGVILIVGGAYILNINAKHKSYLAPFRALFSQTGPRLMLVVAFLFSISSNFDKIGTKNSSPLFWTIAVDSFLAVTMIPILMSRSPQYLQQVKKNIKTLLPIGLFGAIALISQMTAIKLAFVTYVISIKRLSALISVLAGYFIFKEKGIRERLAGAILMILGVILITFSK